jgi:5'-nucleotidase
MKILVSNDDGVYAQGIAALAKTMSSLGQVTVVAPDRNRSGASNSLTLTAPLYINQLRNGFISVEGTPTDCVHIAVTGYLPELPDIVVTGINHGSNLGDDVWYSGTVAAAIEGRFLGLPAIAFSLSGEKEGHYFDMAAKIAKKIVEKLVSKPFSQDTILNVNIPDIPYDKIQGFEVTRLGTRYRAAPTVNMTDPRGKKIYWVGPSGDRQDAGPGTDFYAIEHNRVSITPLRLDLTDYKISPKLAEWVKAI